MDDINFDIELDESTLKAVSTKKAFGIKEFLETVEKILVTIGQPNLSDEMYEKFNANREKVLQLGLSPTPTRMHDNTTFYQQIAKDAAVNVYKKLDTNSQNKFKIELKKYIQEYPQILLISFEALVE